jgi:hypothetical protein
LLVVITVGSAITQKLETKKQEQKSKSKKAEQSLDTSFNDVTLKL